MEQVGMTKLNMKQPDDLLYSLTDVLRKLQREEAENKELTTKNDSLSMLADALLERINNGEKNTERHHELKNHNSSKIENSGNSDIDIKINIDFSSIAFAMLYTLFASKLLTNEELESALKRLEKFE